MSQPESRVLRTDKGMEVNTTLTDSEAYEIVSEAANTGRVGWFGKQLAADYTASIEARRLLSHNKLAWLHRYALALVEKELNGDTSEVHFRGTDHGPARPFRGHYRGRY